MGSPVGNKPEPQRTFWNTYAFHPSEAETKRGKFANGVGAVALGIFTLGLGHALSYYVARKPFKANYRDFLGKYSEIFLKNVEKVNDRSSPLHNSSSKSDSNSPIQNYNDLVKQEYELNDKLRHLRLKRNAFKIQGVPLTYIDSKIKTTKENIKIVKSARENCKKNNKS